MDSKQYTYHIGEIAHALGVSARTMRYYEELGLIRPSRSEGGFRVYTEHDVDLVKLIIRFRDLGMSLEEIRALISRHDAPLSKRKLSELRKSLALRRDEFERRISKLKQAVEQIDDVVRHLGRCARCGEPMEKDVCKRCMQDQGDGIPTLLDPLM